MTVHYYILAGESLQALNKLIEYDTLMTDFRMTDVRKKLAELMGKTGPEEDPAILSAKLSTQFSQAQVRAYKEKLGFTNPGIQVRQYDTENPIYRAYHVYPKLAMNPGTSKANFGIGDLFQDNEKKPAERIAIYNAYEDYHGNHFAPPGARKITEEEFKAFHPQADDFEYYRTYDEGTDMPADFDPAKHQTKLFGGDWMYNHTHLFLATGEKRAALLDYREKRDAWHAPYQDFQRKELQPFLQKITVHADKLRRAMVSEAPYFDFHGPRGLAFEMGIDDWNSVKNDLMEAFDLQELRLTKDDGCNAYLVPRDDTPSGKLIGEALAKVPPYVVKTVNFGFEERPTLENHTQFGRTDNGFPYMKFERYDGGEEKLLVFRMPPNIKGMSPPDCTQISIDDYIAIAGAEKDLSKETLPTHVFRIEGKGYELLKNYDAAMQDYIQKDNAFKDYLLHKMQAIVPDLIVENYELREYGSGEHPRPLKLVMSKAAYDQIEQFLLDHFAMEYQPQPRGHRKDKVEFTVKPQTDTENGRMIAEMIAAIPYEPLVGEVATFFGFNSNKYYDQMIVEELRGMKELVVKYHFPSYITQVEAPEGTIALSREEYTTIMADSWDLQAGSVPPPRPAHMTHLPMPGGLDSQKSADSMKKSKDKDGLPLHQRSEFSWFEKK